MRREDKIDLGSVQVHKKVFAEIIASALDEVEGVHLIQENLGNKLAGIFGQKEFPGIDIRVDDNHEVTLEVQILVRYGMNIPDAARQVQETIKSAIDKTLDINLRDINVNVQGIEKAAPTP
ncbi:MAG: Asp23/Gls24 family envelope stress response protein [Candidatus Omnitrophica bacterium]|nr:Asp23/Gls24 family envelope stress response protein [Candidatus Omnitrophota bacterium]